MFVEICNCWATFALLLSRCLVRAGSDGAARIRAAVHVAISPEQTRLLKSTGAFVRQLFRLGAGHQGDARPARAIRSGRFLRRSR